MDADVCFTHVSEQFFDIAAMKSGSKSWLQVINAQGEIIHVTDGSNLSDFNKYYFEKTFGPFEQYRVKLLTKEIPFPFRTWFVAAVGIPVGIILLFGFVVKAYQALFYGEENKQDKSSLDKAEYEYRFEKIIAAISRFNIFIIGFFVVLLVISYWAIPNLIVYIGRTGIDTLARFKWAFLSVGVVALGMIIWVIYLRYLLAKRTIDSQVEIDKYRLQIEYDQDKKRTYQLEYDE